MRFLIDQDVYALTARFLRDLGHDVVTVGETGRARATDAEVMGIARQQGRILLTRDRDFGALVFVHRMRGGVIYLRLRPSELPAVHEELESVLTSYAESDLRGAFVVVEAGRHRYRRLPP